jgi:D-psicose/D-tagatose/L-ribulose 3-epimerase
VTFAIHTALWHRTWADDVAPYLARAAAIGYDAVEVSLLGAPEAYDRIGRTARELGLSVTCTTGLGRDSDVGSADAAVRAAGRAALERAVANADRLGSPLLSGVLYGAWGVHDPARRSDRLAYAIDAIAQAAPIAAAAGVTLGIEAINRFETDLINTAEQALDFVTAVAAPNVGVLLDTFHMNIEEKDPATALRLVGSHLVHLHASGRDRGVPDPALLDLRGVLAGIGYRGGVACEMFIQAGVDVSADLSIWRSIERDPDDAAMRALAALRDAFA